jgi:phosphohistidine phosphatase
MENEATTPVEAETSDRPAAESQGEPKKARARRRPARKKAKTEGGSRNGKTKPVPKLVVLFRHGVAEDPSDEKADGDRSLTTIGHNRTKRSAKGLAKIVGKVDAIYSSPLLRALQTALWVTKAYGTKVKVRTSDALLPDASPESACALVREAEGSTVVLVGHEPALTRVMCALLGVADLRASLKRAGCAAIQIDEEGRGTLEWMLAPRLLRGI